MAMMPVVGIDNLDVFNFVSNLLDGTEWFKQLPLHLIAYIRAYWIKEAGPR